MKAYIALASEKKNVMVIREIECGVMKMCENAKKYDRIKSRLLHYNVKEIESILKMLNFLGSVNHFSISLKIMYFD